MTTLSIAVTGANGGIGRAICQALAEDGHSLHLIGRQSEALEALRTSLKNTAQHHCWQADLSDVRSIDALADAMLGTGVALDVLINNAGCSQFATLDDSEPDALAMMLKVNTLAPMLLSRRLLPTLLRSEHATLINVGSSFGSIGYPGFSGYCASKFALRGFTEALQRELADREIAIHYLAPRAVATDINSEAVVAMNAELGNAVDKPAVVADALQALLHQRRSQNRYLGWPERLFVRLNALLPTLVTGSLRKQLPRILYYARRGGDS